MISGILIVVIVALLAVLSHRRPRLEKRVFRHVPLEDWLAILVLPIFMYIGWALVVRNILNRPSLSIFPLDDLDILIVTILFVVYGFIGNAFHFTGKILWRYLRGYKHTMMFRVNEMFHGKLSHYLVFLNCFFTAFFLAILEINHPFQPGVSTLNLRMTAVSAIILGISTAKAVFYTNEWFGGYHKPLFFLNVFFSILMLLLYRYYNMHYTFYPVNLFVTSLFLSFISTFVLRQVFIFTRLSTRRRMRFLAKILSA